VIQGASVNTVIEAPVRRTTGRVVTHSLLVLMLLSLVGLGCAFWLHPFWFIAPKSNIDPWLYWGTGQGFRYLRTYFGATYYFRRWTLTIPNYVFEHLFSPYVAELLLRSCLLLVVSFLGGLLAFLLTGASSAGAVATLGFAYFAFIVRSVGMSYNQGTGLALWFAIACLVVKWKSTTSSYLFGKSLGVSVLLGLLFVTYQWTVYLWLPLAALGTSGLVSGCRSMSVRDPIRRAIPLLLTGCIAGFAIVVLLDLEVGRLLRSPWANVVSYTFSAHKALVARLPRLSVQRFLVDQVLTSSSFALLGVAVSAPLAFSTRLLGCRAFAGSLLVLSVTYLLDPWTGANSHFTLQTIIYLSASLIVAVALLISSAYERALGGVTSRMSRLGATVALCTGGTLCTIALVLLSHAKWWVPVSVVAVTGATLSILGLFTERRIVWGSVQLLAASSSAAALAVTMSAWRIDGDFTREADAFQFIQQLTREHRSLMARAVQDGRRIWILDNRPHLGWSPNVSAAYGLYSAFTVDFPPTVSCLQMNYLLSMPNSTVVLYGSTRPVAEDVAMIANLVKPCARVTLAPRERPPESAVWFDISRTP
jgi:hypothetical protein